MSEFLIDYGLFLAKTVTFAVVLIVIIGVIFTFSGRGKEKSKGRIEIKKINDKYKDMANILNETILSKEQLKKIAKNEKQQKKSTKKQLAEAKQRIFVLNFEGDIKASEVASLREEITAVLTVANSSDEVFILLHSSGGIVHGYGLAASQLMRLKKRAIPITVSVDKVAASGGYMMACVANHIIAAPFAILGSIGVLAQLPNFHRLLKKSNIDYELFTAGEFKRTVTMFGENTDSARAKFRDELEDTHALFKEFVSENRPKLDIGHVSTGEYWHGTRALALNLVDEIMTSDDYLLDRSKNTDIFEVTYTRKKALTNRLSSLIRNTIRDTIGLS